jgi:hypothetical protein
MPQFLTPGMMALAGALAIPTLLVFYFLKLKRREVAVPSTLLWKRAVQDLEVNAPFQKLRKNLLLLLQLLILIAAVLALGRPMMRMNRQRDQRVVLLIDQSASMNTRESDGITRLERAKDQAKRLVDDLDDDDQAMLIVFADQVSLVTPFTSDKSTLKRQIDAVAQTDRPTRLSEALKLAEQHSNPQLAETDAMSALPTNTTVQGHMILFSDGCIGDAGDLALRRGSMEIVRIGEESDNVGVVALQLKRNYERPELLNVFARVRNFSDRPAKTDLTLRINGQIISVQDVPELAPGIGGAAPTSAPAGSVDAPPTDIIPAGSVGLVPFPEFEFVDTGVAEVSLSRSDSLAADDRAYAIIPPPRQMSVMLVTPGHMFLPKVLKGLPLRDFEIVTPEQYEAMSEEELTADGRLKYDVVIFDDHATDNLPPGAYIFFGQGPKIDGVIVGEPIDNEYIVTWDDTHPILRYVTLDDVDVFSWSRLTLPDEAIMLVEGETSPVMSLLSRDGRDYLLVAFSFFNAERDALNTTWPLRRSLVVFAYNAMQYLSGSVTASVARSIRPGEAAQLVAPPGTTKTVVTTPSSQTHTVNLRPGQVNYFGRTDEVGLYRAAPAVAGRENFAVNLFDENESRIVPNTEFAIGSDAIEAHEGVERVNQPLWPYLLAAALVVLFVEWYVYNKRVFI